MTADAHNPHNAHILVVDDEPDLRTLYELTLLRQGYRVETAATVQEALQHLQAQRFDVLLSDMRLPDGSGMEVLAYIREHNRRERCIVMTAYGSAENAVEALRAGAFDYLTKPVDLQQFRTVVASAVQGTGGVPAPRGNSRSGSGGAGHTSGSNGLSGSTKGAESPSQASAALARLVGTSEAMQTIKQHITKVARGMAPVLIHGESGTGKELVARALHACSQRTEGPWVAVNCGAIPENLLEAEFFGARKGSYTGASHDREGFFQAARGGTLFLDEIGDLPLAMQSKLLRAIQERSIRPLGATQEESVDVRILSATHHDLAAAVQAGRFRQDLYYRLNVIELHIPPLRERRQDLPALCEALLVRIARDSGLPVPPLSPQVLQEIAVHPLTGNVRELENLLHRALTWSEAGPLTLAPTSAVGPSATPSTVPTALPHSPSGSDSAACAFALRQWLDTNERDVLRNALHENGGDCAQTAQHLGLSPRQMHYRMVRLGLAQGVGQ